MLQNTTRTRFRAGVAVLARWQAEGAWTGLRGCGVAGRTVLPAVVAWGVLGVSLFLAVTLLVVKVVGSPSFPYGQGIAPLTLPLALLLVALWLVTALGEEIMFRGYMQTGLTERYGLAVGLLLPALLWGMRHHPADLYWGWGAPMAQWVSRLGQLYLGALIFGLMRHWSKSTIATWIAHLLLWLAVIIINAIGTGG